MVDIQEYKLDANTGELITRVIPSAGSNDGLGTKIVEPDLLRAALDNSVQTRLAALETSVFTATTGLEDRVTALEGA